MRILNPGIIQVRQYEDQKSDQIMLNLSVTFQTTVIVDLNSFECDANKARAVAMETAVKLLENEIGKHVAPSDYQDSKPPTLDDPLCAECGGEMSRCHEMRSGVWVHYPRRRRS